MVFSIGEDFKLYTEARDVTMTVVQFSPYFNTQSTKTDMNTRIGFLKYPVIAYLNEKLKDGIVIPQLRQDSTYSLRKHIT